jgi:hypothetical protein
MHGDVDFIRALEYDLAPTAAAQALASTAW